MELLGVAGLSAILGALVSAVISVWSVTRGIKHRSVIEQRQKWRDTLRDLVPDLVSRDIGSSREKRRLRDSIALRINPHEDSDALHIIDRFLSDPSRGNGEGVVSHFQVLLKRDWEKAKIEASFWPYCANARSRRIVERQRRRASELDSSPTGHTS